MINPLHPNSRESEPGIYLTEPGIYLAEPGNNRQLVWRRHTRRFFRARAAVTIGRRELLAAQSQPDPGVAEGECNIVAVTGHDDALAYVAGVSRAIAHVLPLPVAGERLNQNHGDFAVRAPRCFEELFDGAAPLSFVLARLDLCAFSPRTSSAGVHAFTLETEAIMYVTDRDGWATPAPIGRRKKERP